MPRLTEGQRVEYERNGFLCPIDVMPPEQAADEHARMEGLERDWEDRRAVVRVRSNRP